MLNEKTIWAPGEHATLRGVGKRVVWAYPTIVVQDTLDLIVLYLPAGSVGKDKVRKPTPEEMLASNEINIVDCTWERTDVLMLIVPGESFSTYIMWETGTKNLVCWYINLQEPIQRTSIGFDTMDNMLDVVVTPDMTKWKWKDDNEFRKAERIGFYSHEKAREIWSEGEKAVRLLTSERRSLYEHWQNWQANPQWEIPNLSPLWDKVKPDGGTWQNHV